MSTPVETIADALIAFIMSLLRDPEAVQQFNEEPEAAMASAGVRSACVADVKAVAPIIIDHPDVRPAPPGPPRPEPHDVVVKEISRLVHQFTTIDNRSTIVDQSVNQNIWTNGGDVTQIFDQSAVIASGDDAVAAGGDATVDESDIDVTVGDVAIGNETNTNSNNVTGTIEESFNDGEFTYVEGESAVPVLVDGTADASADGQNPTLGQAVGYIVDGAVDTALDAAAPAPAEPVAPVEPVAAVEPQPLMADMTASDGYDSGEPLTPPEPDMYVEEVPEDQ